MQIYSANEQEALSLRLDDLERIARAILELEGEEADELSVRFVDPASSGAVHDQFFSDPSPTDCMSFPMDERGESPRMLGDVVVCPQVALDYCAERGGDPHQETLLYLTHGILHLLGYNDLEESDRAEMRAAEERHMANLASQNLSLKV